MRTDALHTLIHSLSPNERRYFKLHSLPGGGQADRNYGLLFDALLAQPVYDEAALRLQFADHRLVRHLSSEKNYLYRLLLRALRAMADSSTPRLEVRAEIDNAILLFERGLYTQCQKLLRRARKLADATEQHLALLEIIVWERRLWKILHDKGRKVIADHLIRSQVDILERLQHTFAYYDLYDRMYLVIHQKFQLRTPGPHPELEGVLADPLLQDMTLADSFEARHFYWLCQAWRHQLTGDEGQLYDALAQSIAWWEAHPAILQAEPARYIVTLSNFLHAAGLLSRYDEFPTVFAKIRQSPQRHRHGDIQVMQTLYYYELFYYLNMADWAAALQTAQETVAFLERAGERVATGRKLAFWYNLSILFFLHADFKSALHWVNAIIDASGSEMREDIQHFARILLIIIHFELGNWEILEYLHRSSYRYLFSRKELHPYERCLLEATKRLMHQPEAAAQILVLQGLQAELEALFLHAKAVPGIQELHCWIDARRSGRSMLEVMGEMLRPSTVAPAPKR